MCILLKILELLAETPEGIHFNELRRKTDCNPKTLDKVLGDLVNRKLCQTLDRGRGYQKPYRITAKGKKELARLKWNLHIGEPKLPQDAQAFISSWRDSLDFTFDVLLDKLITVGQWNDSQRIVQVVKAVKQNDIPDFQTILEYGADDLIKRIHGKLLDPMELRKIRKDIRGRLASRGYVFPKHGLKKARAR
jgi:DNA-binding PadR family transcriptional regulator